MQINVNEIASAMFVIFAAYGMTEMSPGVTVTPSDRRVPYSSAGILLPAMESRIVNPQTGA